MSDISSSLPPVPKGPVVAPEPSPIHPFYVWHQSGGEWALPNGKKCSRGTVLRGADALSYEAAVAAGEFHGNEASPVPSDPEA